MKVCIEVGHGPTTHGEDPGACFGNIKEHQLNLTAAKACQSYLTAHGHQADILDDAVDLYSLGRRAEAYHLFISIHHNATVEHKQQGTFAIVHAEKASDLDRRLAFLVGEALSEQLKIPLLDDRDRDGLGDQKMRLAVLSGACDTNCRARCLAELYFMDHGDIPHFQWSVTGGVAVAMAILELFAEKGETWQEKTETQSR